MFLSFYGITSQIPSVEAVWVYFDNRDCVLAFPFCCYKGADIIQKQYIYSRTTNTLLERHILGLAKSTLNLSNNLNKHFYQFVIRKWYNYNFSKTKACYYNSKLKL